MWDLVECLGEMEKDDVQFGFILNTPEKVPSCQDELTFTLSLFAKCVLCFCQYVVTFEVFMTEVMMYSINL